MTPMPINSGVDVVIALHGDLPSEAPGSAQPPSDFRGSKRMRRSPPPHPFGYKLERYERLSGRVPVSFRSLLNSNRSFEPGTSLLRQGEPASKIFIIDDGWTFSSSSQHSGARQVLDVQIPGDTAGLPGLLRPFTPHDVTAITRVDAFEISSAQLGEALIDDPDLSPFLLWLSAGELAVTAERLTDLGRRTALERTAHFILELSTRSRLVGAGSGSAFHCPMTQYLLGDALGLSSVHVNRMMRELRTAGLAHHQRGWMRVLNHRKLVQLAGFDGAYLECVRPHA